MRWAAVHLSLNSNRSLRNESRRLRAGVTSAVDQRPAPPVHSMPHPKKTILESKF